jgi:hypothetical protein
METHAGPWRSEGFQPWMAQHFVTNLVVGERAPFKQRAGDFHNVRPIVGDGLPGQGVEFGELRRRAPAGEPELLADFLANDVVVALRIMAPRRSRREPALPWAPASVEIAILL